MANSKIDRLYFFPIIIFLFNYANVTCVNIDNLSAYNPIYGLSSIADSNSSTCFRQLRDLKNAVDTEKVWGLKVLDSSGRPPEGFLYGNNLWIGSHTQCIDIQNRKPFEIRMDKVNRTVTRFDYPPYELGFAMVMMRHNNTLQYHMRLPLDNVVQLGLCIPKSCSEEEILYLSERYFSNNSLEFQQQYETSLKIIQIRILEENALWMLKLPKTIIFLIIVTIMLAFTIVGTTYDLKQHNRRKKLIQGDNNGVGVNHPTKIRLASVEFISAVDKTQSEFNQTSIWIDILKCFSFYSNVKRWTKIKTPSDSLPIIHGLRFLSMGWVILVHTSFFQGDFVRNPPYAWRLTEDFMAQIVSNSTYCVDTYLFLSGFLLAYLFFRSVSPNGVTKQSISLIANIKKFLYMNINRFLRLTPTYAIVILLCDLVYTYYSTKSSLYFSERPDILCDFYWWRNILYINNLYPRAEMCLSWSWYLSADMQFFTIGAFLLILSTLYFKTAAALVLLMILVQIIATAYKSYSIGYIPTLDDQLEQLDAIYDLPWNRIGPYMVGIITAYILVVKLKNQLVLKERIRLTLWLIFPLINLSILFALYTRQVSVEFSAFYMGVSRTFWGVGIAWFVVALSTGNARLLEKVMSYSAWVPLGRLTYCTYLLNPLVITMVSLGSEDGIMISVPEMAITANGTIMITMMLSFLFSLVFESPFILLTKLLFRRGTVEPKNCPGVEQVDKSVGQNGSSSTINTIA